MPVELSELSGEPRLRRFSWGGAAEEGRKRAARRKRGVMKSRVGTWQDMSGRVRV